MVAAADREKEGQHVSHCSKSIRVCERLSQSAKEELEVLQRTSDLQSQRQKNIYEK